MFRLIWIASVHVRDFLLTGLIDASGPGWLHLLVLTCIWNAIKFVFMGPVSVILLARAHAREWRERRDLRKAPPVLV